MFANRTNITIALCIYFLMPVASLNAQTDKPGSAQDTTKTAVFAPVWKNMMSARETEIMVGTEMRSEFTTDGGWKFLNVLRISKKNTRGKDIKESSEMWTNSVSKASERGYRLNISLNDGFSKRTSLGLARFGKEVIFEDKVGLVNFSYIKPLLGAVSSEIKTQLQGSQGTHDFKKDRSAFGGIGGNIKYVFFDKCGITGSAGIYGKKETSKVGDMVFGGLPSRTDTFRVGVYLGEGKKKTFMANYYRLNSVEHKITPPRGNSLEILDRPQDVIQERIEKFQETLSFKSSLKPADFLSLDFTFNHRVNDQKYRVDSRLSRSNEDNRVGAALSYKYHRKGTLRFKIDMSDLDNDYGPASVSSFREKEKKLALSIYQNLTDSLYFNLRAGGSLKQRFFKKYESNPRDADYLYYNFDFSFHSAPVEGVVSTNVSITANRKETINISSELSSDNRVDYLYRVMPSYSFRPTRWLILTQKYTIKIEYTDFVFKDEENYINRTTSLVTGAKFVVLPKLLFSFEHSYLMKDTGSYLPRDGERLYNRNSENLDNGISMKTEYRASQSLVIRAETNFRNQRNSRFGVKGGRKVRTAVNVFESGGLKVGFIHNKKVGDRGAIKFDISYVRNFGPYISDERKEYWLVDSSIAINF